MMSGGENASISPVWQALLETPHEHVISARAQRAVAPFQLHPTDQPHSTAFST
jgi:hypothetical protein